MCNDDARDPLLPRSASERTDCGDRLSRTLNPPRESRGKKASAVIKKTPSSTTLHCEHPHSHLDALVSDGMGRVMTGFDGGNDVVPSRDEDAALFDALDLRFDRWLSSSECLLHTFAMCWIRANFASISPWGRGWRE